MYNYRQIKERLYTDAGMDMYIEIRDRVLALLNSAGAVRMENDISEAVGETFIMMACVDRMVEKGILKEIHQTPATPGQHRLFVRAD